EGAIEWGSDDVRYQLADLRTSTVDDRPQPAHLFVEFDDAAKLVDDWLGARDIRERAAQGCKETRNCVFARQHRRRRMGIDIDQTAIDLSKCRPAVDRRDRFLKRTIV